jgi:DNA-binding transcriptional regulator GbsR (MarR family)
MAETIAAPVQGQAPKTTEQAAQAAMADTGKSAPQESYFEYVLPDGKKEVYQTKDDLAKAYRDNFLRQSDYTRKTQEVAQTKKQIEEERKKFQEEMKAFTSVKQRYDEMDRVLKTRPDIYSQLERAVTMPPDAGSIYERSKGYVDETVQSLKSELDEMKKQLEEERTKKELDSTFMKLREKYPDLDEGQIMERLEYLSDGKTEPLIELLYWAAKGQMTPAQEAKLEEKVTENLHKKRQAAMVPGRGATVSPSKKPFRTSDEARSAAFEEMGITPQTQ